MHLHLRFIYFSTIPCFSQLTNQPPDPRTLAALQLMVVFNVKYGGGGSPDGEAFLYEATTDTPNDRLIASLVAVHNGRVQASIVAESVRGLISGGPMENPSVDADAAAAASNEQQQQQQPQPSVTVRRTGERPAVDHATALSEAATELERYVDKAQAQKRVALTPGGIQERMDGVRRSVELAYPEGLPEWEMVRLALGSVDDGGADGDSDSSWEGLKDTPFASSLLDAQTTSLWVAGKEFDRHQLISDRLGRNEKTRVVAKLSRKGDGPPTREPIVREDERNAMLEHYHKRQEELKRLADNEEDEYMNSVWADPKNMKRELQGLGSVRAPGLHRFG